MKHPLLLAALVALISPALTACSGTPDATPVASHAPAPVIDPSDRRLQAEIQTYLAANKGPKNSQYEYVRADLNGDGLREGLVMFTLPHSYWCGWSGCTLAVFEAGDNSFAMKSKTARIRGPIVVGTTQTNGWGDIGVRVSGTDYADRNVLLKFDGTQYPATPVEEAEVPYDLAALGGARYFP